MQHVSYQPIFPNPFDNYTAPRHLPGVAVRQ